MATLWVIVSGLFILGATCYLLFITSDPLEAVGGRLGKLLKLPGDVIASTFQALATSGPEIVMAILAATPFILGEAWAVLALEERAASGTLNMAFSAMDNLLGIGAVALIFMISKGMVRRNEVIAIAPSGMIGLGFYVIASALLTIFIWDGTLTVGNAWTLMIIGIVFVLSQFFIPGTIERYNQRRAAQGLTVITVEDEEDEAEDDVLSNLTFMPWTRHFTTNAFIYAFLVFALIIFVREALGATFNMATATQGLGFITLGGILLMFTSYVSSFPEFMMTYRFAIANKKAALLGMLFGSNVIDLAFAGFLALWLGETMVITTSGIGNELFGVALLPFYILALPVIALLAFIGLLLGKLKYKIAVPLVVFYVVYILSGFILL